MLEIAVVKWGKRTDEVPKLGFNWKLPVTTEQIDRTLLHLQISLARRVIEILKDNE
jgi:hypothetical protein